MTAQTGRTVQDFTSLLIGAAGGSMNIIKVDTLGDIGLDYPEEEISAFVDGCKGVLVGKPGFELDFTGPVDNTATTGTSILLRSWAGVMTALSFDVQIGIRHAWEAGEPQFGLSGVVASNSGIMITKYKESGSHFSGRMRLISGSAVIPAWGIAAEIVPA